VSEATKNAVEDALKAHLADEAPDTYLTEWAVVVTGVTPRDTNRYLCSYATGMSHHSAVGLTLYLHEDASTQDEVIDE